MVSCNVDPGPTFHYYFMVVQNNTMQNNVVNPHSQTWSGTKLANRKQNH